MRDFKAAARLFEDRVDRDDYFDAATAELTKSTLLALVSEPERRPIFLLGDPGVGKSKMLHTLAKHFAQEEPRRLVVHLQEPFFGPEPFLKRLLEAAGEAPAGELEEMKKAAVACYGECEHLIMIDEAQLLEEPSLEFLRILSDTKAFRFLLSMHREEGEAILQKPHFKSRSHKVVEIGRLDRAEVGEYLNTTLLKEGFGDLAALIDNRSTKRIHRYAEGNFRQVKRMAQSMFELMGHAQANGMRRFMRPGRCLLDMAAIDVGLLDA
ncbi:AAA family ATPase [Hydrogenimonas sp.]